MNFESLQNVFLNTRIRILNFLKDENGETNIIAIILIILVVIALAAIFRKQLTDVVNKLFDQIRDSLGL